MLGKSLNPERRRMLDNLSRAEAITNALDEYRSRGDKRTQNIDFRGESKPFEVVRVGLNVPYLNHDNSRLRAQLATHPDRDVVLHTPTSSAAQEILSDLLRKTEKYKELKTQLEDLDQKNPGVISRDGMLVNGNTRLVALRDIGANGIDVAVLPSDATTTDFFEIEMSLQLVSLIEQPYTFTNQLLLVQNLRARFPADEAIFKAMAWQRDGAKRLAKHLRWLAQVEEIRRATGYPYEYFDDKEEMIKNLESSFQGLLAEDPKAAEDLKWNRVIGMALGLNKDEVRKIDEDFLQERLEKSLDGKPEGDFIKKYAEDSQQSGLEELLGNAGGDNQVHIDGVRIVQDLLTRGEEDPVFSGLYRDFKLGARELIEQQVKEQIRTKPLEYLEQVTSKIEELSQNLPTYFADPGFSKGTFSYKAKRLQKAIRELEGTLARQLEGND